MMIDPEVLDEKWSLYNDKHVLETERDILVENLLYLESTLLTCNGPRKPRCIGADLYKLCF